jgi:hypothetical protein
MGYVFVLLLIVGGILGMSGLIIANKPDAKALIDKLVPYQALIGVALLAVGILYLLLGGLTIVRGIGANPIYGIAALAGVISAIVLGALFGMSQIAKWIPGDSPAEQKAMEISQKVAPYQALLGVVAAGSGVVILLYLTGLIKLGSHVGLN